MIGKNDSATGGTFGVQGNVESPGGVGVLGENTALSGETTGVWGNVLSPLGEGTRGQNTSLTGATFGVVGIVQSTAGAGVAARNASLTGNTFGVTAFVDSPGGIGVFGDARATSSGPDATGVWGETQNLNGAGVVGIGRHISGGNFGVWGQTDSPNGLAGFFSGDVDVAGTLNKTMGAFKIDHPLDPAGKYLYHSFVESPDMKNIYDGVVVLEGNGEATVELPDYFEALNRDFRYQLTPIGGPAPGLFIAQEILDNRFRIGGGQPDLMVSWQVTGTRQDAYALKHPIVVEEAKPPSEVGSYIHPEVHGQPKSASLAFKLGGGAAGDKAPGRAPRRQPSISISASGQPGRGSRPN